jgi:hypothetical protein
MPRRDTLDRWVLGIEGGMRRIIRALFLGYGPAAAIMASMDRRACFGADDRVGENSGRRLCLEEPPARFDARACPRHNHHQNVIPFTREAPTGTRAAVEMKLKRSTAPVRRQPGCCCSATTAIIVAETVDVETVVYNNRTTGGDDSKNGAAKRSGSGCRRVPFLSARRLAPCVSRAGLE